MSISKILIITVGLYISSLPVVALTDPSQKTSVDLYLEGENLVRKAPTRFSPQSLATASVNIEDRIALLPFLQDKNADRYLVIPQLGLITPIIRIPQESKDYKNMLAGKGIEIDPYLTRGVLEYAGANTLGTLGQTTIFGHSNQYKKAAGDYKTIFASLFRLDPTDQLWVYDKQSDGNYIRHIYTIEQSYLTNPSDVNILQYDGEGSDITLFGCAYGLKYRRVIKATLIGTPTETVQEVGGLSSETIRTLDLALQKLYRLPDDMRKEKVEKLMYTMSLIKKKIRKTPLQQKIIEYLEYYLPQLLP